MGPPQSECFIVDLGRRRPHTVLINASVFTAPSSASESLPAP